MSYNLIVTPTADAEAMEAFRWKLTKFHPLLVLTRFFDRRGKIHIGSFL